ncbi:anucleate primary sterigmata protein b [Stemphylium lycopersici]|nr:anucleate primary sterigmata protein b [Stemphylium lycopersici]
MTMIEIPQTPPVLRRTLSAPPNTPDTAIFFLATLMAFSVGALFINWMGKGDMQLMIANNHRYTHHNLKTIYSSINNITNTVLNIEKSLQEALKAFTVARTSLGTSLEDIRTLVKRLHKLTTVIEEKINHIHQPQNRDLDPTEAFGCRGATQRLLNSGRMDDEADADSLSTSQGSGQGQDNTSRYRYSVVRYHSGQPVPASDGLENAQPEVDAEILKLKDQYEEQTATLEKDQIIARLAEEKKMSETPTAKSENDGLMRDIEILQKKEADYQHRIADLNTKVSNKHVKMKEAYKFLEQQHSIAYKERQSNQQLRDQIESSGSQIQDVRFQLEAKEDELQTTKARLDSKTNELREIKGGRQTSGDERIFKLQQELNASRAEIEDLTLQLEANNKDLQKCKNDLNERNDEIQSTKESLQRMSNEFQEAKNKQEASNKALKGTQDELRAKGDELQVTEDMLQVATEEVERMHDRVELTMNELKSKNVALEKGEKELRETKKQFKEAKEELNEMTEEMKEAKEKLNSSEKDLGKKARYLDVRHDDLKGMTEDLERANKELGVKEDETEGFKQELEDTDKKLHKAKEELEGTTKKLEQMKNDLDETNESLQKANEDLQDKEDDLERSRVQNANATELQNLMQSLQAELTTQKKTVESQLADAKARDERIAEIQTKTNTVDTRYDAFSDNQQNLGQELTTRNAEMDNWESRYNGDGEQPGILAMMADIQERMAALGQETNLVTEAANHSKKQLASLNAKAEARSLGPSKEERDEQPDGRDNNPGIVPVTIKTILDLSAQATGDAEDVAKGSESEGFETIDGTTAEDKRNSPESERRPEVEAIPADQDCKQSINPAMFSPSTRDWSDLPVKDDDLYFDPEQATREYEAKSRAKKEKMDPTPPILIDAPETPATKLSEDTTRESFEPQIEQKKVADDGNTHSLQDESSTNPSPGSVVSTCKKCKKTVTVGLLESSNGFQKLDWEKHCDSPECTTDSETTNKTDCAASQASPTAMVESESERRAERESARAPKPAPEATPPSPAAHADGEWTQDPRPSNTNNIKDCPACGAWLPFVEGDSMSKNEFDKHAFACKRKKVLCKNPGCDKYMTRDHLHNEHMQRCNNRTREAGQVPFSDTIAERYSGTQSRSGASTPATVSRGKPLIFSQRSNAPGSSTPASPFEFSHPSLGSPIPDSPLNAPRGPSSRTSFPFGRSPTPGSRGQSPIFHSMAARSTSPSSNPLSPSAPQNPAHLHPQQNFKLGKSHSHYNTTEDTGHVEALCQACNKCVHLAFYKSGDDEMYLDWDKHMANDCVIKKGGLYYGEQATQNTGDDGTGDRRDSQIGGRAGWRGRNDYGGRGGGRGPDRGKGKAKRKGRG